MGGPIRAVVSGLHERLDDLATGREARAREVKAAAVLEAFPKDAEPDQVVVVDAGTAETPSVDLVPSAAAADEDERPGSASPADIAHERPAPSGAGICPVCDEFPATESYRGGSLCHRCLVELRGW